MQFDQRHFGDVLVSDGVVFVIMIIIINHYYYSTVLIFFKLSFGGNFNKLSLPPPSPPPSFLIILSIPVVDVNNVNTLSQDIKVNKQALNTHNTIQYILNYSEESFSPILILSVNKSLDPFSSGVFVVVVVVFHFEIKSTQFKIRTSSPFSELFICGASFISMQQPYETGNPAVSLSSIIWIFPEQLDSLYSHRRSLTCACSSFSSLQLLPDWCFYNCVFDLNESHALLYTQMENKENRRMVSLARDFVGFRVNWFASFPRNVL